MIRLRGRSRTLPLLCRLPPPSTETGGKKKKEKCTEKGWRKMKKCGFWRKWTSLSPFHCVAETRVRPQCNPEVFVTPAGFCGSFCGSVLRQDSAVLLRYCLACHLLPAQEAHCEQGSLFAFHSLPIAVLALSRLRLQCDGTRIKPYPAT